MLCRRGVLRLFLHKYRSNFPKLNRFTSNLQPEVFNKKFELDDDNLFSNKVMKYEKQIIYNTFTHGVEVSFSDQKFMELKERRRQKYHLRLKQTADNLPVSLTYLSEYKELVKDDVIEENIPPVEVKERAYFPFKIKNVYLNREEIDSKKIAKMTSKEWMKDYDGIDDKKIELENNENEKDDLWKLNYGLPDPNEPVSDVKCGGCGAILHCINTTIPGYLPSDILKNYNKKELRGIVCQRCHFLSEFNVALNINVSPDEYPKIISQMKDEHALAVLLVDLLDFPNSIWPNIVDIIGSKRPVIIVGNKVDMLPIGKKGYLEHITESLKDICAKHLQNIKIKHVSLISAKTGYGVEELITSIQSIWKHKGDMYIIGCTNVGKSTLFNALLQSDLCKSKASDLIQKATVSQWPGTTMNLLKFPMFRIDDYKLKLRNRRLFSHAQKLKMEKELEEFNQKSSGSVTLMGYIGRTFRDEKPDEDLPGDPFAYRMTKGFISPGQAVGIDENSHLYMHSKWCYDTPGVVHPEQILSLLTLEELNHVLPKSQLIPRTYYLRHGTTLFLAGLGRLDFIYSKMAARLTVFASEDLPVTICNTSDAEEMYAEFLGTPLFGVPFGDEDRLKMWPKLESGEEMTIIGEGDKFACADITLSSSGWVSVTGIEGAEYKMLAWTPEKKGINLRQPSVMPDGVNIRGRRIVGSPAYNLKRKENVRYIMKEY